MSQLEACERANTELRRHIGWIWSTLGVADKDQAISRLTDMRARFMLGEIMATWQEVHLANMVDDLEDHIDAQEEQIVELRYSGRDPRA